MGAVMVKAKPDVVDAWLFDGTEADAKALRSWAIEKGGAASFFWHRGAWNDQSPEPAVKVQGLVLLAGSWVVAGPVWQVLLAEKFAGMYEVAA